MKVDKEIIESFDFPEPFEAFLLLVIGSWYRVFVRVNYFKVKSYEFNFGNDNGQMVIREIRIKESKKADQFYPVIVPMNYGFKSRKDFDEKMHEFKTFLELME